MDEASFRRFLTARRADLERIARFSRGRASVDDLVANAWIAASGLMCRADAALDLDLDRHADQDAVLAGIDRQLARERRRADPAACSLDHGRAGEDGEGPRLVDRLAAPAASDPQALHELLGHRELFRTRVQGSYSQAAAYVLLLDRVDWEFAHLADLLRIGLATLRHRLMVVIDLHGRQGRLFDGIERIDADFAIRPRLALRARQPGSALGSGQVPLWA